MGELQLLAANLSRSRRSKTPPRSKKPASNYKTRSTAQPAKREEPSVLRRHLAIENEIFITLGGVEGAGGIIERVRERWGHT